MVERIVETAVVWAIPVLFAITLHEAAHAFAAHLFGDSTAKLMGRMSLNPLKHIDPLGTIIIPAVMVLLGSPFIIGYAKPVPIYFARLNHPRRDSAFVAAAGPLSNLLQAFIWAVLKLAFVSLAFDNPYWVKIANAGIAVNLVFFAFNLFPLPPLDGGRILTSLLPPDKAAAFAKIERWGFFIVLALVYVGLTEYWLRPVMAAGQWVLTWLLYPIIYLIH